MPELRHRGEPSEVSLRPPKDTFIDAINLADSLIISTLFEEAKSLLRKHIPVARRALGNEHDLTLDLRNLFARVISRDPNSSRDDVHEAVTISEDVLRTTQRVFGTSHPYSRGSREDSESARMRQADDESREAFTAEPAPSTRRRRRRRPPKDSS